MKVTIFEGTAQEIAEVFPNLTKGSAIVVTPPVSDSGSQPGTFKVDDEVQYVSVGIARKLLSRRKLSKEQRQVLLAMYKAHPGTVSGTDLQKEIGYSRAQFSGLMGAMGRRCSHTEGYIDGTWLFEQKWDDERATYLYGLPETVREAMRLEKLV